MRFLVFLFGFVGCSLTAVLGVIVLFQAPARAELNALLGENSHHADVLFDNVGKDSLRTGLFLLIGAGLGLFGTLLALCRCGWQGSLLLLVPLIGPAILNPFTLAGTAVQGFSALLSLLVGP